MDDSERKCYAATVGGANVAGIGPISRCTTVNSVVKADMMPRKT